MRSLLPVILLVLAACGGPSFAPAAFTDGGADGGDADAGPPDGGCHVTSDCPFNRVCEEGVCAPVAGSCELPTSSMAGLRCETPGTYLGKVNFQHCGTACPAKSATQSCSNLDDTCEGGEFCWCRQDLCLPTCTDTGVCPSGFNECLPPNFQEGGIRKCGAAAAGTACWAAAQP